MQSYIKSQRQMDKSERFRSSLACRIRDSPYEQDEPCKIVIDYHHERPVECNSRRNGEVQQDVGSLPIFQLGLFHLQHDLVRSLSVMTETKGHIDRNKSKLELSMSIAQ